jgi:hypothetical protein
VAPVRSLRALSALSALRQDFVAALEGLAVLQHRRFVADEGLVDRRQPAASPAVGADPWAALRRPTQAIIAAPAAEVATRR